MATYQVSRGNETYEITAPDEATAMNAVQQHFGVGGKPETTVSDVARGAGSGAVTGAIAGLSGAGVGALINDAVQGPANLAYRGIDALLGTDLGERHTRATGGAFGSVNKVAEASQALADKAIAPPVSEGGKLARAVTGGAVEAIAGSGLFKVAGRIFQSYPEAVAFAEQMAAAPIANAAYSAAASGGAELAQQEGVNPLIGTAAGLAAAATGHAAGAGLRAAPGAVRGAFEDSLLRTSELQEQAAAARLRGAVSDPAAVARQLEDGAGAELVPGSRPTLYEATGDTGAGQAQGQAFTEDTGGYRGAIEERRAAQNTARVEEIKNLGGEGDKTAILDTFRRQREILDQSESAAEGLARSQADTAAGKAGTTATAEEVGAVLRGPMAASEKAVKAEGGRLYDAIGAEGITVGTGRLKAAVGKEFAASLEKPLSADEKYFADLIRGYSNRLDFNRLQDLRSEVVARGRQFSLPDNTRRRFRELKIAIDQAMDDGLARAVKDDPSLLNRAAAAAGSHGGDYSQAGARAASGGGLPAGAAAPESGSPRQAVGGLRTDAGGAGIPPREGVAAPAPGLSEAAAPAAAPNVAIDDSLTQAQRAANAHWRDYKLNYGKEPILKRGPTRSGFAMEEAGVPGSAFPAKDTGGARIRALKAAGATDDALAEAAAFSMQKQAIKEGVVDPTAFRRWKHNHAAAIAELPPAVQQRFQSAADAAATLEQVSTAKRAAMRKFDESAVGKVLNTPVADLEKTIKSYLETPSKAHELANAVSSDPAAKAGLQRLAADYILRQFTNASDDVSKAALTTFIKRNRAAMAAVFGNEGALRMQRLSDDIERARKQVSAGKDPGGPSTAADTFKAAGGIVKNLAKESVVHWLAAAAAGGPVGVAVLGAAKGLKAIHNHMRLAGIKSVDELYARALLDPELARKLLTKGPALKSENFRKGLGTTILRSSALGAAYGDT